MSEYSQAYMDKNFFTGYTAPEYGRGYGWNKDENSELAFPHSVPLEAIDEKLGDEPIQVPMLYADPFTGEIKTYGTVDDNGVHVGPKVVLNGKGRDVHPVGKNDGKSNLFSFRSWFLDNFSEILETNKDELGIGFFAWFRNGSSAAMQIDLNDTIKDDYTGVAFRSSIYGATSLDGSMRPQYGATNQIMVCDNTFRAGQSDAITSGLFYSLKQTANARFDAVAARSALAVDIVRASADAVAKELQEMARTPVSNAQWFSFLDSWAPLPDKDATKKSGGRGYTLAATKRDELEHLYTFDNRVAPWAGTKFGVSQAVTTWSQHFQTVKRTSRLERNKLNMINGESSKVEAEALALLDDILANA